MAEAHASADLGPDLVGRTLMDRYIVQERIASGGMSVVFRGFDERLRRPVCIKLLRGIDGSPAAKKTVHEHFVREAFTLSRLRHPNTVRIYDFGRLPDAVGTPFQVCEFAEGGTVRDKVRRLGPMSPREALAIIEPIASALAEAHDLGVVHRDVKPSNILLCRIGAHAVVKLADFGIARSPREMCENDELPTQVAEESKAPALYSLNWAAPEQISGEPGGPAADIFSLGLVATYLMTGRLLFGGDDFARVLHDRQAGDDLLEERIGGLDIALAVSDVILRACRDDPAERFSSVEAFVDELREVVVGPTTPATPARPRTPPPRTSPPPADPARESQERREASFESTPASFPSAEAPSSEGTQLTPVPVVTLDVATVDELVVGGRRIRIIDAHNPVAIGGSAGGPRNARLRVAVVAGSSLHIKGLDCFVGREGGRPTSGISADVDTVIEMLSPGQQKLGSLTVGFGSCETGVRTFCLDGATVVAPTAVLRFAVMLDAFPEGDAILLALKAHGSAGHGGAAGGSNDNGAGRPGRSATTQQESSDV